MLNQVLNVSSGTCQQSVEVRSKSVTFLDFWLSQGSVATYCMWGGNLYDVYLENFLTNHLVKEFWNSVHICQSYHQISTGLLFWKKCRFSGIFSSIFSRTLLRYVRLMTWAVRLSSATLLHRRQRLELFGNGNRSASACKCHSPRICVTLDKLTCPTFSCEC